MRQFLFLIAVVFPKLVVSQDEIESSLFVVDTTTYNGDTIYVFNDKSWEYATDYQVEYTIKTVTSSSGCVVFDSLELFQKNWNTNKTFSNQYNLANLNDSITVDISGFFSPVAGTFTSGFKLRWGKWHKGNDVGCAVGSKVHSGWGGVVRYAQYNQGGYGNLIIVRHYNGLETYYAHLSKINVVPGQKVDAGELIGLSGNTGASKGPHLHFEVRILDNAFDPKEIKGEQLIIHRGLFYYEMNTGASVYLKKVFQVSSGGSQQVVEKKQTTTRTRRKTAGNM